MTILYKAIKEFKDKKREDKIFYLSCLKKIGQLGKRLCKLQPNKELKNNLILLYKRITEFEL